MTQRMCVRIAISIFAWLLTTRVAFGQACYESSILTPTPFMGNNGEIFKLADGSLWEIKYEYEYLYEYYPKVTICPSRGRLIVRGKTLTVQQIKSAVPPPPSQAGKQVAPNTSSPQLEARGDDALSFYDAQGQATAYFEPTGDLTVYLWTGEPVAYLDGESIFGLNGKHLGWFHDGLIYDHDGGIVVAPSSAFRQSPGPPPLRSPKNLKPLRGLKELRPLRPLFGRAWSKLPARVFFLLGAN